VNRREMLTRGVRQLTRSLSTVLMAGGGLAGLLRVNRAVAVKEEARRFPRRASQPREFSQED